MSQYLPNHLSTMRSPSQVVQLTYLF